MGDCVTLDLLARDNCVLSIDIFQALPGSGLREEEVRDPGLTPDIPSPADEIRQICGVHLQQSGLGCWGVAQGVGARERKMAPGLLRNEGVFLEEGRFGWDRLVGLRLGGFGVASGLRE